MKQFIETIIKYVEKCLHQILQMHSNKNTLLHSNFKPLMENKSLSSENKEVYSQIIINLATFLISKSKKLLYNEMQQLQIFLNL